MCSWNEKWILYQTQGVQEYLNHLSFLYLMTSIRLNFQFLREASNKPQKFLRNGTLRPLCMNKYIPEFQNLLVSYPKYPLSLCWLLPWMDSSLERQYIVWMVAVHLILMSPVFVNVLSFTSNLNKTFVQTKTFKLDRFRKRSSVVGHICLTAMPTLGLTYYR